ncbi:MAG: heme-binding domain-containing protein [Ignavibacteriales bacterium]|nr:heme-binding domain-containing protein [Ignavibacteriales bacterium]
MKKIVIALVVILVGIQFVPVERTNPSISWDINAPEKVASILRESCYDCHSNETDWPWYSHIAPVSFLVAGDVNDARKHLNFSEWDKYEAEKREKIYEEIVEEIEKENMPLPIYTFTHPGAKLDDHKIKTIKEWVQPGSSLEDNVRYK